MRALILGIAATGMALAQFTEIAATDDASQVFVTTQLVIDGVEGVGPQARIFQIAGGRVTLFAQTSAPVGGNIGGPQVSANGSVAGYSNSNLCRDNICSSPYSESYLQIPNARDLGAGNLHLSRNGRWALLSPAAVFNAKPGSANLIDLQTGTTVTVPSGPVDNYIGSTDNWAVASDGTVLTGDNLWKAGQSTTITITSFHAAVALSDDASTVILETSTPGSGVQLIAHDVASGREIVIADSRFTGGAIPATPVSASANGRYILYRLITPSTSTTFIGDTASGQSHEIPLALGETMTAGIMNGPGTLAVMATSTGRLLQVALAGGQPGAVTELVPQTYYLGTGPGFSAVAIGSLTRLTGSVTGTVDSLQGKIKLDSLALPILDVSGTTITAQIPWELGTGQKSFQIDLPSNSPFRPAAGAVAVLSGLPQFERGDGRTSLLGMKILAEDFSGYAANPLAAGAVLHAYMTGMGPVNGPVQTGIATGAGVLNSIQGTITCRFAPQMSDAQTLFAGLAPGMIGVYQVDFKLADEGAPVRVTGYNCRASGPGFSAGFGAAGPPAATP